MSFNRVILLTDGKAGHENQSRALARALGAEPVVVQVAYRSAWHKALSYLLDRLGIHTLSLYKPFTYTPSTAATAVNAVIGTGSGTFYAVKSLARKLHIPSCVVLYPRGYVLDTFTCILAPAFDRPQPAPNVVQLPVNLVSADASFYAERTKEFLQRYQPRKTEVVAIIVGGPNKCSTMTANWMRDELERIFRATPNAEHWVTTSRRTPNDVEAVVDSFPFDYKLLYSRDHFNPIPAFVQLATQLYVTAESTGMLSEVCTFGTATVYALDNLLPGRHKFRRFVEDLRAAGYVDGSTKVNLAEPFKRVQQILTENSK